MNMKKLLEQIRPLFATASDGGTSMADSQAEGTTSRWPEQQSRLSRRPRQPLGWVATAPGVLEALAHGQAWPAHF